LFRFPTPFASGFALLEFISMSFISTFSSLLKLFFTELNYYLLPEYDGSRFKAPLFRFSGDVKGGWEKVGCEKKKGF
jgi:hypothetical protein